MKHNDTINQRVGYLIPSYVIDEAVPENTTGPLLGNKRMININIANTLPLMIMPGDLYTTSLYTEPTPVAVSAPADVLGEIDNDGNWTEERFTYLGSIVGPIYRNTLRMYYDKDFSDIIVIPDLAFTDVQGAIHRTGKWDIQGYRIGGGIEVENTTKINAKIKLPETATEKTLPEVNALTLTPSLHIFGGVEYGNNATLPAVRAEFETLSVYTRMVPETVIKFGKGSAVFKNGNTKVPIYIPYQGKVNDYRIKYVDIVDVKDQDLYVLLKF